MSKHNYSQYSNNNKKTTSVSVNESMPRLIVDDLVPAEPTPESDVSIFKMEVESVDEIVETAALPELVKGVVSNCARLNVRAYPSLEAEVICVLDVMSEVEVYDDKSTYDWLCVCTATGIEGYCMKKFVETDL